MNAIAPTYVTKAEPVFLDHLLMQVDQEIAVQTVRETLKGRLAGVAIDHLQLNVNGVPHHIRLEHVVYFSKA
ncbi:YuzF family protein [Paenibacillus sp. TRM 82003]|nr:YuzF family protein [Paenibacillus sp. TRM 82003]